MAFYIKKNDKKSGDGLSMTEWNDINRAVGGDSGLTLALTSADRVGIGTATPAFKLHVNGSVMANKYVVQNETDGGNSRGIFLWAETNASWGIYLGQSGANKSLSGGVAVTGAGFTQHAVRFRANNNSNHGFLFENSSEELLLSIRGSDGMTHIRGNVGIGTTTPAFKLHVDGSMMANKYVVQNATDGGNTRGIFLWQETDTNWGIYMGTPGAGKSLSGGVAVAGAGFTEHAVRFRAHKSNARGFLFENTAEELLMSIRGDDGMTHIKGNVGIGTIAPTEKLEVNGKVKATHFIGDGSLLTNLSVGLTGLNLATTGGNVGIGTNSPSTKLEVAGTAKFNGVVSIGTAGSLSRTIGYGSAIQFLTGGMNGTQPNVCIEESFGMNLFGTMGVQGAADKPVRVKHTHLLIPEGNVGIGIDNPTEKLEVKGKLKIASGTAVNDLKMYVSNSGLILELADSDFGKNKCALWNGDNNWDFYSDLKLKTQIANEENILSRLLQLDVKNYNWKTDPDRKVKMIGFIAQDVQPLFPAMVGEVVDPETQEKTLTLKYGNFGILAVGAIKEMKLEYDQKLVALEKEIVNLKNKITKNN